MARIVSGEKIDKALQTTLTARAITESEIAAREAKTARLKKLREQKEAAEAEAKPAAPATTKRRAPARRRKP
jgi:hypothetical protein